MSGRILLACALGFSLAGATHAASTSIPSTKQVVTGPGAALEDYAQAFRNRSPEGIGAVLTADFRSHHVGDGLVRYTAGLSREDEMRAVRGMLEGVTRDGVVVLPAPDTVSLFVDGVSQSLDPEHPDSTEHYRVLVVRRFEARPARKAGDRMETPSSTHVFHVVRGDAAILAEGRQADPERWHIRRWLNDVSGVRAALSAERGGCGEQDPPAGPAVGAAAIVTAPPGVLAIRPLASPACASLRVSCDLPGAEPATVEVYDVSGRLVNRREVAVKAPGTVSIEAGAGARLLPGVYWVRLGQAARGPSTRMVVVAR